MTEPSTIHLAWALLGLYLVVALVLHERSGMKLGGVLVLPLLLLYAIMDLTTLLVFAVATLGTYTMAMLMIDRNHPGGRGTLLLHLLLGFANGAVWNIILGRPAPALLLGLLPGLYAYNLHREGTAMDALSRYLVVAALFVTGTLAAWHMHVGPLPLAITQHLPTFPRLSAIPVPVRLPAILRSLFLIG